MSCEAQTVGLPFWLVPGRWLRLADKQRLLLAALAIAQVPGALVFAAIFAVPWSRYGDRSASATR